MPLLTFIVIACLLVSKDDYFGQFTIVAIVFAVVAFETPILGILWNVISFLFEVGYGLIELISS